MRWLVATFAALCVLLTGCTVNVYALGDVVIATVGDDGRQIAIGVDISQSSGAAGVRHKAK